MFIRQRASRGRVIGCLGVVFGGLEVLAGKKLVGRGYLWFEMVMSRYLRGALVFLINIIVLRSWTW